MKVLLIIITILSFNSSYATEYDPQAPKSFIAKSSDEIGFGAIAEGDTNYTSISPMVSYDLKNVFDPTFRHRLSLKLNYFSLYLENRFDFWLTNWYYLSYAFNNREGFRDVDQSLRFGLNSYQELMFGKEWVYNKKYKFVLESGITLNSTIPVNLRTKIMNRKYGIYLNYESVGNNVQYFGNDNKILNTGLTFSY